MSSFNENDEEEDNFFSDEYIKPKILLFGLRRSGKSSIQKVVFHKMSPNETLFLESTNKVRDKARNIQIILNILYACCF
jgi:Ras-related GTP-binding protein C/D